MRLALSVVFSSVAGYLLGVDTIDVKTLILLAFGGYFMVGASNAFNQIIEKDLDALMSRTKNRPIPAGRMSVTTAFIIASVFTVLGIIILYTINPQTAMFGAISIFLYTSVYTPLKTRTPLAVFVGAIPGAIPFMLGWVAATDDFGIEPGTLFMIQFFWQFPHFWAIGWFLFEDYKKGGFFMLPTGKQDKGTAVQTIMYTIWTIIVSIIPVFGFTGKLELSIVAAIIVFLLGLGMLYYAIQLFKKMTEYAAKQLMLASVSYITLIQIVYVVDKIIRYIMDLTQGTSEDKNNRAKKMMLWFGIISLIMSFAAWTSAFIVSSTRPDWLKDFQLPNAFIISTIVILISSVTFVLAKKSLKSGNNKATTTWLLITLVLGIIFIFNQFTGFREILESGYNFTGPTSNVTMSYIFLIAFVHVLHVVVGIICLLVVIYNHFKLKYNPTKLLGFELAATFWHFVDILWLYLFLFLYFFR